MTLPAQDIALDPLTILAGIEHFGLASDGCDLRDLKASISRLTADNEALRSALEAERAAMDVTQRRAIAAESRADALAQEVEKLRPIVQEVAEFNTAWIAAAQEDIIQRARAALGDRP